MIFNRVDDIRHAIEENLKGGLKVSNGLETFGETQVHSARMRQAS